jgi:regulatory Fis family protein
MNAISEPRPIGYHGAVTDFKRRLIETTLHQASGNRTHAARALGLQRTYLLRLMRELAVAAPPPPQRRAAAPPAVVTPPASLGRPADPRGGQPALGPSADARSGARPAPVRAPSRETPRPAGRLRAAAASRR